MSLTTVTFTYYVKLHVTNTKSGRSEEHTVLNVVAYSLQEAIMQAIYLLDAEHDFIKLGGYEYKVVAAGPDVDAITKQLVELVKGKR